MTSFCLRSVAAAALAVVAGSGAGCDQVLGLEVDERDRSCGDGELLAREGCDDGNTDPEDGCTPTCEIEPNFECRAPGAPCLPVLGLVRDEASAPLEPVGETTTGNPFEFACPTSEVLIGFEANPDLASYNLGAIRAVCGTLALTPAGALQVTRATESALFGAAGNDLLTVQCGPDEVATGFVPRTQTYVSGFGWLCQPVAHTGGALELGAPRVLAFGLMGEVELPEQRCPPRAVVTAMAGTSGASIDSLGLGCSALSVALCGDGEIDAPEECDDGNLTPGDGCGRRCTRE